MKLELQLSLAGYTGLRRDFGRAREARCGRAVRFLTQRSPLGLPGMSVTRQGLVDSSQGDRTGVQGSVDVHSAGLTREVDLMALKATPVKFSLGLRDFSPWDCDLGWKVELPLAAACRLPRMFACSSRATWPSELSDR